MKRSWTIYLMACALASAAPVVSSSRHAEVTNPAIETVKFPGWPEEYEGKPLTQIPLLRYERSFYKNFPGKIGRFTDGEREIILRWMATRSSQFHLSTACFRAAGFKLNPMPIHRDHDGKLWGSFTAHLDGPVLEVKERIEDSQGRAWTDESSWRWDSFWKTTTGPWWAYTIASTRKS